jgi:L-lactate dehydrogenase (cytochrome)
MSVCSIEDVAEQVSKPFWFQLYIRRDRCERQPKIAP